MAKNKTNWQREDKTLDYIAAHRAEITRYLVVVLVGEVWRWVLDNIIYNLHPLLQTFQTAGTFLLWALPYFLVCKLWVWKQKGDNGYVWCIQAMKFMMAIIIIAAIGAAGHFVMQLINLSKNAQILCGHLLEEVLYFIAMFKFIIRPQN